MIPSPFVTLVLVFAVYRLTRLVGWDEFPLAVKIRSALIGEEWVVGDKDVKLPGKTPESAFDEVRPGYRRPLLAHLVHCPFCVGWWVSLTVYAAWLIDDRALYALYPFALSGAAGLLAKNLDS